MPKQLKQITLYLMIVILSAFMAATAAAEALFESSLTTQPGTTVTREYDNFSDMFDDLDGSKIVTYIPSYIDPADPLSGDLNFRGLPMSISSDAGSSALTLEIPATGFSQTFEGVTRDESLDMIEDWFKEDGGSALDDLFKKLASETPIDPVAGNPNSLMSRMVSSNFDAGFFNQVSLLGAPEPEPSEDTTVQENPNLLLLAARFSSFEQGPYKSKSYTLPFGYSFRFDGEDPRRQVRLSVPISFIDVEGAQGYSLGIGCAYTHPLTPEWVITPEVSYGTVGSEDLGSIGHIMSGSVTSALALPLGDFRASIGNLAGYYSTLPLSSGDFSADPGIGSFVIRNGLMFFIPTVFIHENTGMEVFFIDTRFFGDDLFNEYYNEIGFSYGFTKRYTTDLRIGLTFTLAEDNDGVTVNVGYTF